MYVRSQFILARHGQGEHNPHITKGVKKYGHLLKENYLAFMERMIHDSAILDPALRDALLTQEGIKQLDAAKETIKLIDLDTVVLCSP